MTEVRTTTSTPGGIRLRALREYMGQTQLNVELDASLGIGYLQRVESGKVKIPERDTLERILSALKAGYTERRDILELFGYRIDTPLPSDAEIEAAIARCWRELEDAVFPAYLLDCGHRLLAWNPLFTRMYDLPKLAKMTPQGERQSMIHALFTPGSGVFDHIANADAFIPAQVRAFRYEMRHFRAEAWHELLIENVMTASPLFAKHWTQALAEPAADMIAARPLIPLELDVPKIGRLRFRITSEPFAQDRRFRVIYYIPADAATIQACIDYKLPLIKGNS